MVGAVNVYVLRTLPQAISHGSSLRSGGSEKGGDGLCDDSPEKASKKEKLTHQCVSFS